MYISILLIIIVVCITYIVGYNIGTKEGLIRMDFLYYISRNQTEFINLKRLATKPEFKNYIKGNSTEDNLKKLRDIRGEEMQLIHGIDQCFEIKENLQYEMLHLRSSTLEKIYSNSLDQVNSFKKSMKL